MDSVVDDLAAEHRELERILRALARDQWARPTRCTGWDVADVVLHLAQTDEMAVASAAGDPSVSEWTGELAGVSSVDEGAALMVARERGLATGRLLERWATGAATLVGVLAPMDPSTRVTWVSGRLSVRTLATTRLAETWIHGGDVAAAVGIPQPPTDRLGPIARLAWRTLPYAFSRAGLAPPGPTAFHLVSPTGVRWDLEPEEPATTTIRGPAAELCEVAARRTDPSETSLVAEGPDAAQVLALVRTYA